MRTNIKTTNLTLTPEISDYLVKRLSALDKFSDTSDDTALADVEIGKTTEHHREGPIHRAEINLQIKGQMYRAVAERETLFEAIDKAKDEIQEELRRTKSKRLQFIRRGGARLKDMLRGFRK